jgi:DNA-directed RNA polymerase subunit RPC12/RpoP
MAWLRRAPRGTTTVDVLGKPVTCPHCGGDELVVRKRLLNTAVMTLLGFDFADRQATTLRCIRCGRIEWFGRPKRSS